MLNLRTRQFRNSVNTNIRCVLVRVVHLWQGGPRRLCMSAILLSKRSFFEKIFLKFLWSFNIPVFLACQQMRPAHSSSPSEIPLNSIYVTNIIIATALLRRRKEEDGFLCPQRKDTTKKIPLAFGDFTAVKEEKCNQLIY